MRYSRTIAEIISDQAVEIPQIVEEFFAFKRKYRAYLVKKRFEKMNLMLETCSVVDEEEKFLSGRAAHGGEWKPEMMLLEIEMRGEALDFANYSDIAEFVQYRFDPEGFEQFVSQL